jgi:hypothetical protein
LPASRLPEPAGQAILSGNDFRKDMHKMHIKDAINGDLIYLKYLSIYRCRDRIVVSGCSFGPLLDELNHVQARGGDRNQSAQKESALTTES